MTFVFYRCETWYFTLTEKANTTGYLISQDDDIHSENNGTGNNLRAL